MRCPTRRQGFTSGSFWSGTAWRRRSLPGCARNWRPGAFGEVRHDRVRAIIAATSSKKNAAGERAQVADGAYGDIILKAQYRQAGLLYFIKDHAALGPNQGPLPRPAQELLPPPLPFRLRQSPPGRPRPPRRRLNPRQAAHREPPGLSCPPRSAYFDLVVLPVALGLPQKTRRHHLESSSSSFRRGLLSGTAPEA